MWRCVLQCASEQHWTPRSSHTERFDTDRQLACICHLTRLDTTSTLLLIHSSIDPPPRASSTRPVPCLTTLCTPPWEFLLWRLQLAIFSDHLFLEWARKKLLSLTTKFSGYEHTILSCWENDLQKNSGLTLQLWWLLWAPNMALVDTGGQVLSEFCIIVICTCVCSRCRSCSVKSRRGRCGHIGWPAFSVLYRWQCVCDIRQQSYAEQCAGVCELWGGHHQRTEMGWGMDITFTPRVWHYSLYF